MKESKVYDCTMIALDTHHSRKGNLSVVSNGREVPFDIRRVYYSYDIPGGQARGAHAHKQLYQLLIAASGSFTVTLDDGSVRRTFLLNHPYEGLLIVPGIWRVLDDFSSGAICLCLASETYDKEDYIRDYDEFIQYKHGQ
ncbi:MAG: WxcM-like domain-containing protein [Alloprevotella sp.]|nr:WxcM-like domain-containing protein [Alloprevotella sp.]